MIVLNKLDYSLHNHHDNLNSHKLMLRMATLLVESGVGIKYGDYFVRCLSNGHIKVLKSLGLYKTVGKGANKKTMAHELLVLTMKLTVGTNEVQSKSLIELMNGKYLGIKIYPMDLSEYNRLPIKRTIGESVGYNTYLFVNHKSGLIKIGKSRDVVNRLYEIQKEFEDKTISLLAYKNKDIEYTLHVDYKDFRVHGEWFNISIDDALDIANKHNFDFKFPTI